MILIRRNRMMLTIGVILVGTLVGAVWLPVAVMAMADQRLSPQADRFDTQWRLGENEATDRSLDARIVTLELALRAQEGLTGTVHRNETKIKELEDAAEPLKRIVAVLDFMKWEATIAAGLFGASVAWLISWTVKTFRKFSTEVLLARRDARIARYDDFEKLGGHLITLLDKTDPGGAAELTRTIQRRHITRAELMRKDQAADPVAS